MKATVLNFITRQLLARNASKLRRVDPVAGQESVDTTRGFVPVFSVIEDHDAPPRASEDRGGAQSGGARAHNDDVVKHCDVLSEVYPAVHVCVEVDLRIVN